MLKIPISHAKLRMFKNICKNIKTYKFSYAKNIEILVQFSKKILRTLKVLKFQKSKNIGSRILLVLIKKDRV